MNTSKVTIPEIELTNSQKTNLVLVGGAILTAALSSWSEGHIDVQKFVYALIVAAAGACHSYVPKAPGKQGQSDAPEADAGVTSPTAASGETSQAANLSETSPGN
ncbi:MAG: hypothetical protein ABIY70_09070 [Capsulimonas sp.]|uniref:hypothetical protein n=1 Tax=Capsulimonas sp. TaxID=2494211 RepID=UPI003267B24D